jgi:translation initiation factor RLI1
VETQENAEEIEAYQRYKYPAMSKTLGDFKLTVMEGEFTDSQIIVMLGENGTGKTTFIRMLVHLSTLYSPPPFLSANIVRSAVDRLRNFTFA